MRRLQAEHYLLALFGLAILALGLLLYQTEQKIRALEAFESRLESSTSSEPDVKSDTLLPSINPHAESIEKIEADAGMKLSRIARLIIRDEGKRNRPYLDPSGAPTIGVGRNLRGNGISVAELQAIVEEIDYDVLLKETHVQGGRVRIGSIDLSNRIFTKPLTEHDIALLLTDDLNNVRKEAVSVFGEAVWSSIEEVRKEAILDVVFNLGLPHFREFVNFIEAVRANDWDVAAAELLLSDAARKNIIRYHRNATVLRTADARYFDL